MTAPGSTTPYPPPDEPVKRHYWPEYVELSDDDTFTTDYQDQLTEPGGPVGFHVFGRCPRCRCRTSDILPLVTVGAGPLGRAGVGPVENALSPVEKALSPVEEAPSAQRRSPAPPTPVTVSEFYGLLECRCATNHFPPAGAPEGSKPAGAIGCGTSWMTTARLDPVDNEISVGPTDPDIAYRAWTAARASGRSAPSALTTMQANAATWQRIMTALLGLLVVTSLVGGRSVLETMGAGWQIGTGIAAGLSLITNAWSIFLLGAAASGRARLRSSGGLRQLENADLEPLRAARRSERRVGFALLLVLISLATALVALLLVWFAPPTGSSTVDVTVHLATCRIAPPLGRTTC